jgi:hypothetical protein
MSEDLAIMIVMTVAILTTGGVLILRPLTRRLGGLLEVMTQERLRRPPATELTQIRDILVNIDGRLNQIEERQDFAEALISAGETQGIGMAAPVRAPERH